MHSKPEVRLRYTTRSRTANPEFTKSSALNGDETKDTGYGRGFWCNVILFLLLLVAVGVIVYLVITRPSENPEESMSLSMLSMTPTAALASPRACPMADRHLEDELSRLRTRIHGEANRRGTVE